MGLKSSNAASSARLSDDDDDGVDGGAHDDVDIRCRRPAASPWTDMSGLASATSKMAADTDRRRRQSTALC